MLALVAFLAAVVVWVVRLLDGDIDANWGFLLISIGLVLLCLPESVPGWARAPRRGA